MFCVREPHKNRLDDTAHGLCTDIAYHHSAIAGYGLVLEVLFSILLIDKSKNKIIKETKRRILLFKYNSNEQRELRSNLIKNQKCILQRLSGIIGEKNQFRRIAYRMRHAKRRIEKIGKYVQQSYCHAAGAICWAFNK